MSMKTTFTSTCAYEGQPESKVVHETDAEDLHQVLEAFEHFLRGSTFVFNGRVDIVDDDVDGNSDNDYEAICSGLRDEIDCLTKLANDRLGTIEAMEAEVEEAKEDARLAKEDAIATASELAGTKLKAAARRDELAKAKELLSESCKAPVWGKGKFNKKTHDKIKLFFGEGDNK